MRHTAACILTAVGAAFALTVTQSGQSVGRYQLWELTIAHSSSGYANVWENVSVEMRLTTPADTTVTVGGFYYARDTWKVRFMPWEQGTYRYTAVFADASGRDSASGTFSCVASAEKGFIRQHPDHPYRLVYETGPLFNGLGWGDCHSVFTRNWGYDGGSVSLARYLSGLADTAGFNVFRWSVNNCAPENWQTIAVTGNVYLEDENRWGDTLIVRMREKGVRVLMDFFGWKPQFPNDYADSARMAAVRRYVKYCVDRWGALVDFWQLCNETTVPDAWASVVGAYLCDYDPYHHLASISWGKPKLPELSMQSLHWYETEDVMQSDLKTRAKFWALRDQFDWARQVYIRRPIVCDEQGNGTCNMITGDDVRARIRTWTAFFVEGMILFWNTSGMSNYCPASGAANLYIGREERVAFGNLQRFSGDVEPDVQWVITPTVTVQPGAPADSVRLLQLQSSRSLYVYLRNAGSATRQSSGLRLTFDLPAAGTATWYHPSTGQWVQPTAVVAGSNTVTAPAWTCDLALRVRADQVVGTGRGTGVEHANGAALTLVVSARRVTAWTDGPSVLELIDACGRTVRRAHSSGSVELGLGGALSPGVYAVRLRRCDSDAVAAVAVTVVR